MDSNKQTTAASVRRWHVHVDDDIIDAATEDEARAEFIQALVEDGSLLYISKAEAVEGGKWRDD